MSTMSLKASPSASSKLAMMQSDGIVHLLRRWFPPRIWLWPHGRTCNSSGSMISKLARPSASTRSMLALDVDDAVAGFHRNAEDAIDCSKYRKTLAQSQPYVCTVHLELS